MTLSACERGASSPYLFRAAAEVTEQEPAEAGNLTLQYVRTWGTAVGPESFSVIGPVAISEHGVLAAYDGRACEIVLFDLATEALLGRFGRCGEGPGDFSRVSDIAFAGRDTIIVYDGPAQRLHYLLTTGQELRRVPVPFINAHGGVQALFMLSSDSILASRSFMGGATLGDASAEDRHLLVRATANPPGIHESAIEFPAVMDEHRGNLQAGYSACVRPGKGPRRIGLMNRWAFETLILDGDSLTPIARYVTKLDWGEPRAYPREPDVLMPYGGVPTATCSEDWVMFSQFKMEGEGRDMRPAGGYIEVRDYSGARLGGINLQPSDTMLFGLPVAARKDRVFYRVNRSAAYPQILEFRLTSLATAARSE